MKINLTRREMRFIKKLFKLYIEKSKELGKVEYEDLIVGGKIANKLAKFISMKEHTK